MIETMIPAGIVVSMILRPIVSANNNNQPPSRIATGINSWFLGPTKVFAICGAINPIKEIPPVTETAAAANATAVKSKRSAPFQWKPQLQWLQARLILIDLVDLLCTK